MENHSSLVSLGPSGEADIFRAPPPRLLKQPSLTTTRCRRSRHQRNGKPPPIRWKPTRFSLTYRDRSSRRLHDAPRREEGLYLVRSHRVAMRTHAYWSTPRLDRPAPRRRHKALFRRRADPRTLLVPQLIPSPRASSVSPDERVIAQLAAMNWRKRCSVRRADRPQHLFCLA